MLRFFAVAAGYVAAFVVARYTLSFSLTSPPFVLIAMICFLGLASVARPVISIRMPGALRTVRGWEAGSGVYRALGVRPFGKLLRNTPLKLLNTDVYATGGAADHTRLRAHLEAAEASHFWDAVLVVPYMVYAGASGAWTTVLLFTAAQVLLNAYPVMHLRLTRHRLDRLSGRRSPRTTAPEPTGA